MALELNAAFQLTDGQAAKIVRRITGRARFLQRAFALMTTRCPHSHWQAILSPVSVKHQHRNRSRWQVRGSSGEARLLSGIVDRTDG